MFKRTILPITLAAALLCTPGVVFGEERISYWEPIPTEQDSQGETSTPVSDENTSTHADEADENAANSLWEPIPTDEPASTDAGETGDADPSESALSNTNVSPTDGDSEYDEDEVAEPQSDVDETATESDEEPETVNMTSNAPVTIEAEKVVVPEISRPGYTLLYWSDEKDGSGSKYYPGDVFETGDSDTTLYAIWEEDSTDAAASEEENAGSETATEAETESRTATESGEESETAADTFTHLLLDYDYYTDDGKTISEDGSYRVIESIDLTGDMTIKNLKDAVKAEPEKEGYEFIGWNTKSDGTGISLDDLLKGVSDTEALVEKLEKVDASASKTEEKQFERYQDQLKVWFPERLTSSEEEQESAEVETEETTEEQYFVLYAIWEKEDQPVLDAETATTDAASEDISEAESEPEKDTDNQNTESNSESSTEGIESARSSSTSENGTESEESTSAGQSGETASEFTTASSEESGTDSTESESPEK